MNAPASALAHPVGSSALIGRNRICSRLRFLFYDAVVLHQFVCAVEHFHRNSCGDISTDRAEIYRSGETEIQLRCSAGRHSSGCALASLASTVGCSLQHASSVVVLCCGVQWYALDRGPSNRLCSSIHWQVLLEELLIARQQYQFLKAWNATMGGAYFLIRDLKRAEQFAIATRDAARQMGDHAQELTAAMYLAYQLYEAQRYREALSEFQRLRARAVLHDADEVVRMLDSAIFRSRRELASSSSSSS
eukprot:CAMPEP_0174235480 /NCGR_PEP_ID=MMETSP0417-20130205/4909_1 /TAXON_ID=242541 /ORGANISM="Mayorella sp, Strain BSH-02190019" /LENGTH=247 /DNA_ID=CAMNT_0015313989 /DNA_START=104 /DNA_END=843 /DNA_ORIENTATION=-